MIRGTWEEVQEYDKHIIEAAAAAERARIVEFMERDETVEICAKAAWHYELPPQQDPWDKIEEETRECYRIDARSVLCAVVEALRRGEHERGEAQHER